MKRCWMTLSFFRLVFVVASLGAIWDGTSAVTLQRSDLISPEVMNAINAMSASVHGTGFPRLGWVDLPSGRELQMDVKDTKGQRWILGVDQATAAPRTKLCFGTDGTALVVVDKKTEPQYGSLSGQPVHAVVGQAINKELARLAEDSKGPLRISTITASGSQETVFVVSWESSASSAKGTFAIDAKGKVASPPKGK